MAGLSAIGTAKNMGAIVRAFDTRPAVKEQVHSLGAEFLEMKGFELEEGKWDIVRPSQKGVQASWDTFCFLQYKLMQNLWKSTCQHLPSQRESSKEMSFTHSFQLFYEL